MDETDRPDDRRADGSWVLPNSESRRQRNHEAAQSGIQKRKKTRTYPRLSCKIEYLLASNHSGRSIASEFFTGDQCGYNNQVVVKPRPIRTASRLLNVARVPVVPLPSLRAPATAAARHPAGGR